MKIPFVLGRLLFGGYFLFNGIEHLRHPDQMGPHVKAKGVPAPEAAVIVSAIPLLVGGASLMLGIKPRIGAAAILAFLGAVSPVMHDFWRNEDPQERMTNMTNFLKNAALAGAALTLFGIEEPWDLSIPVAQARLAEGIREDSRSLVA
jgi:putative oxidoreductase